jgi:uncharacterized membrane protein YgaE (UPF0421/DUF939 family)
METWKMMEFWLVIKVWASRAWAFIKKYWQIFVGLVYTISVWVYFKAQTDKVKEVLKVKEDSHRKEIDTLNVNHAEEIALRDDALEKYHQIITKIEKEYEAKKEELSDKKRAEVKKLVAENSENPSNLSKLLSERFGITHVESGEE